MNWHEPIISPAMGAYLAIGGAAIWLISSVVARMLNDRRPVNDPFEDEFRGHN